MALKKSSSMGERILVDESESSQRAKQLFSNDRKSKKENKILTTFSIEPSFKRELEEMFSDMGLGWAAGIRFALKEFSKKYSE